MWNSEAPLELLKTMPTKLTLENLKEIQKVIDRDKFKNSEIRSRDLCGSYAPFCDICNRDLMYPCAVSYIMMKQQEGMEVEMEPILASESEDTTDEVALSEYEEEDVPEESVSYSEEVVPAVEEAYEDEDFIELPQKKEKLKVRIAVAKRKWNK